MQFDEFPLTIQKRNIHEFVRETGKLGTNTDQGKSERKPGNPLWKNYTKKELFKNILSYRFFYALSVMFSSELSYNLNR